MSIDTCTVRTSPLRRAVIGVLIGLVGIVGMASTTDASTPPPATEAAPAPTDPPAPTPTDAPAPVTVPDADVDDDGDTDWIPIVLIAIGAVALIALLAAIFGRSKPTSKPKAATTQPRSPQPRAESPQVALLSTAQWIHDQLTLELLASNPGPALTRWNSERTRLDNVAIGAQQQFASGAGDPWQSLAQMMSVLASSLDTNLQLRTQEPVNAQLVAESTDVVNRHRATLQQLLTAMWPLAQR